MRIYKSKPCSKCGRIFVPTGTKQKQCNECRQNKANNKKKCKTCGSEFIYKRKDEIYCGLKCKEEFRLYYENSTLDNVYIKEDERQKKPTDEYIKEVDFMLKDFQIEIDIPKFKTVAELDRWKNKIIKTYL